MKGNRVDEIDKARERAPNADCAKSQICLNLTFFKRPSKVLTSLYSHEYLIFTVVLKTYSQTNIFILSFCIIKIFNIPL